MLLLTNDYQWSPDYNNVGGLQLVSSTIPSSDVAFNSLVDANDGPLALAYFNPGIAKIRGSGRVGRAGSQSTRWGFGYWSLLQYQYLQVTFGGALGVYEGFCTIRTRVGGIDFANYNAVMNIPTPDQLEYIGEAQKFNTPFLTFTRMRLIT